METIHNSSTKWKASNPEINLLNGTEWKSSPSSRIIKVWWVLLLISGFGALTGGFIVGLVVALTYNIDSDAEVEYFSESIETSFLVNIVGIPILIISINSTIYFIHMIRQIST
jgi:hypothetical protein